MVSLNHISQKISPTSLFERIFTTKSFRSVAGMVHPDMMPHLLRELYLRLLKVDEEVTVCASCLCIGMIHHFRNVKVFVMY